jgi:ABC-2 type transport system ATP-binding protein
MTNAVEVKDLSYAYGRTDALHDLDLEIPTGSVYALLGPNGAGKTTLLQLLMGLRRARHGRISLLGVDSRRLTVDQRARIGYVAEGQRLPAWMRLETLEAYLAPLYPTWDAALARDLRDRFALDSHQRIGTMSRGQHMKAALLCALASRPSLLLMDEPFTGMDVVVKDDLVRGLLASADNDGWTVIISSHDIGELELMADRAGFLQNGRLVLSDSLERLQTRFRCVTVVSEDTTGMTPRAAEGWRSVERAGRRLRFVLEVQDDRDLQAALHERFPGADSLEVDHATLREIFVAMARPGSSINQESAA